MVLPSDIHDGPASAPPCRPIPGLHDAPDPVRLRDPRTAPFVLVLMAAPLVGLSVLAAFAARLLERHSREHH